MTPDELAARLEARQVGGAGRWLARCPAHDDRNPSLSIAAGDDGRILLRCHAGCDVPAIVGVLGLELADLFPPRPIVTRYALRNGSGTPVAVHERIDGPDGKRMTWQRPDGARGLGRVPVVTLPLYGADRLPADPDKTVVLVEGERAADALTGAGRLAVATVTGAATIPSDAVLSALAGRDVILWPDADAPGRQHMSRIAAKLASLARSVRWLEVPDARQGDDAADLLAHAADPEAALREAGRHFRDVPQMRSAEPDAPSGKKQSVRFLTARELATETSAEVEWIWPGYAAVGAMTELDGKPKAAGKTTFLCHGIAAVLDGHPFLGQPTSQTPIVMLSEQPPTSLRATLGRIGLLERDDLSLLLWREAHGTPWPDVVAASIAECRRTGARLLIVDTLPQFAGLRGDAENDAGAALEAVLPLQAAAADGLAVVVARHDRKSGGDVGDSARGSGAFTGAVDIVLALSRGDGQARPTIRHLLALSRFEETPAELIIELGPDGFVALGSESAVAAAEAGQTVLEVLAEGAELTMPELVATGAGTRTTVQAAVAGLLDIGRVTRSGAGRKGDPYRYSRPNQDAELLPEPIRETYIGSAESISARPDAATLARQVLGDGITEFAS